MNRLKDIIYDIIGRLASLGPRKAVAIKKILIIRVDEIGDYMLWHKFLRDMVTANEFKGFEFHFCGNQSWQSLFNTFDAELVDKSFWMDKRRFKKDMAYRYRFLNQLYQQRYDTVINATFSRDKRYDDSVVMAAKAAKKVGMAANLESFRSYDAGYDLTLYSRLFEHPAKPVFEFYRNKLFTEFVTGNPSSVTDTKVAPERLPTSPVSLPGNYFVVFPGSRSKARIWPTENFVRVSNYLFETYHATAVVCGTQSDKEYTQAFCDQYKHPLINLTGKTSLVEMLSIFTNAQCLLSVDTGSVHLAAAVGCTVFGVFNGSQYKRFAPYPAEIAPNFYAIYPDELDYALNDVQSISQKYEFVVRIPYALVKPEKVIHAIYQHYSDK